ncbi:hypothetical protein MVES1_003618 [Malassezia vespertilionis]|nr:uncharacterized protein MVES1_003618 [Malassezia vespertilionis]WFD08246.1 hypothetical protein MVES1_003618 [Malassezia vespertilionis]
MVDSAVPGFAMPAPLARGLPLLAPEQQPEFDVDAFLCSRAYGQDTQSILGELRAYSNTLHEQLVHVINEKYREIVMLATKMHNDAHVIQELGENADLSKASAALAAQRQRLVEKHGVLSQAQSANQAASEEKRQLLLLLDIDSALDRVQDAMKPCTKSLAADALSDVLDAFSVAALADAPEMTVGSVRMQEEHHTPSLPMRLDRALPAYTKLEALEARVDTTQYGAFLAAQAPRKEQLQAHLVQHAEQLLRALFGPGSALVRAPRAESLPWGEATHEQHIAWLRLALRVFTALHADTIALALFSDLLIRPMLESQPPVPNTYLSPALCDDTQEQALLHSLTGLSFHEHTDLDEAEALVHTYNAILTLSQSLRPIFACAAEVGTDVFALFWQECAAKLVREHGNTLFFVGRPNAFHQNYTISQAFLHALLAHAPNDQARADFYTHEATRAFERRWQLSAFFQLASRTMVAALETGLAQPGTSDAFQHAAFAHLLRAFVLPWRATRHIRALSARQWRLSLHVLSRYQTWLATLLSPEPDAPSRTSTPSLDDPGFAPEEVEQLQSHALLLADAMLFETRVRRVFSEWIVPKIAGPESVARALQDALDASLGHAEALAPRVGNVVVTALQHRCAAPLRHVRAASTQYRALATDSQQGHVHPSAYIAQIFTPLYQFLGPHDGALHRRMDAAVVQRWAEDVVRWTLSKYADAVDTILRNLESLRRLKRGAQLGKDGQGADNAVFAQLL